MNNRKALVVAMFLGMTLLVLMSVHAQPPGNQGLEGRVADLEQDAAGLEEDVASLEQTAVSAFGLDDFAPGTPPTATLRGGFFGIVEVNNLAPAQLGVEVVFDDPNYASLQSTVVVSIRGGVPRFIAWDALTGDSVRVRVWNDAGSEQDSGNFSILLFTTP